MSYHKTVVPDESKAAQNPEICRKQFVLTDRTNQKTKSAPRRSVVVPAAKSYVELEDGSIVDEEEYEAVKMISELTKSIKELAKSL